MSLAIVAGFQLVKFTQVISVSFCDPPLEGISMIRKRILLCEDNQILRKILVDLLKHEGHQVLDLETADEALLLGREKFDSIDVLLTDVEMPGTDGIELAKQISVLHPTISIFVMSGNDVDLEVIEQIPAKFFHKPFPIAELTASIQDDRGGLVARRDIGCDVSRLPKHALSN